MSVVLLLLISYLIGALPIGLYVGKLVKGIDVRDFGSGNIGASNVWRTLGPGWGVFVFILDVAKGLLPTLAARHEFPSPEFSYAGWLAVGAGITAILGHNFSPFLKFKGGKGVATSLGVCFGLSWIAGLIGFGTWLVFLGLTRYISIASMLGTIAGAVSIWWFNSKQLPYGLFSLLATIFVFVKHRPNIARLRDGTEPKAGKKKA